MLHSNPQTTAEQVEVKYCPRCKEWKEMSDFHRNRASKDGRQAYCKRCLLNYQREPERAKNRHAYQKEYNQRPEVIEERRKRQREYHETAQKKRRHRANMAVGVATKNGTLPKVSTLACASCGQPAQEYHHWAGYAEKHWLHVLPLCVKCHREIDAELRS